MAFSEELGELQIIINANDKKYRRALKRVEKNTKKTAERSSKSINKIGKAFLQLGAVIAGLRIFGTFAKSVLQATANIESLGVAFESILGSVSKADALVARLEDFSARTPFQLEGIAKASRQLLAAGVPVKNITNQLKILGDIASGANIPLNDMASIFSKVKNKGKAMTEELLQLSDRGIPIIQILADKLDVSKDAIFKMGEQSEISFDIIVEAFQEMSGEGGIFFDQMTKQSETLQGKWSTLTDNIVLMQAELGKLFAKDIKDGLDLMIKMAQETRALIKEFSEWKKSVGDLTKSQSILGTTIGGLFSGGLAGNFFQWLQTKMDPNYKAWINNNDALVKTFGEVEKSIEKTSKALENTGLGTIVPEGGAKKDFTNSARKTSGGITNKEQFKPLSENIGEAVGKGLRDGFSGVGRAIREGNFESILDKVLNNIFDNIFDAIFQNIGQDLAKIFGGAKTASGGGFVGGLFSGLFDGFFAGGGNIASGHFGIAGEGGMPEVISGPATVTPLAKLGGGGGDTITNIFNISPGLPETVAIAIERVIPRIVAASTSATAQRNRNGGKFNRALAV